MGAQQQLQSEQPPPCLGLSQDGALLAAVSTEGMKQQRLQLFQLRQLQQSIQEERILLEQLQQLQRMKQFQDVAGVDEAAFVSTVGSTVESTVGPTVGSSVGPTLGQGVCQLPISAAAAMVPVGVPSPVYDQLHPMMQSPPLQPTACGIFSNRLSY